MPVFKLPKPLESFSLAAALEGNIMDIDNIVLEHLVALRNEIKEFRQEAREELQIIRMRLNSVERTVSGAHDDNVIV
jgi:hypothetical protein